MSTLKLLALLLVSFIATGSIIYQIRNRRPPRAAMVSSQTILPEPASATAPAPDAESAPTDPIPNKIELPAGGWGRNPFLTPEEILRGSQPATVAEAPAPQPAAQPAVPAYSVTAIISGPYGNMAVINKRVVQEGDRIGYETVKEINSRSVVLEHEGRTRELEFKKGTYVRPAPKGEMNR